GYPTRCDRLRPEREGDAWGHTVSRNRERARTQTDRGPSAFQPAGSGHRLDPVAGGECEHRTGVREGRPQRISTARAPTYKCRRPALVVGRCEQYQYDRPRRHAAWPTQDTDRFGRRKPSGVSRTVQDSDVHSDWHWVSPALKKII